MRGIGRAGYGSVEVDGLTGIIEKSKEAYLEVALISILPCIGDTRKDLHWSCASRKSVMLAYGSRILIVISCKASPYVVNYMLVCTETEYMKIDWQCAFKRDKYV